jgi:hypothetical protein
LKLKLTKYKTKYNKYCRSRFLWQGNKEAQGQKRPVCLANWTLITTNKELEGLGVKDLVCMNQTLLLKWMWQWIDSDNAWWKEASQVPAIHIRPWEITNTTKFWSDLQTLLPIFQSLVQFQLGAGTLL